jgi:hypothetical protein
MTALLDTSSSDLFGARLCPASDFPQVMDRSKELSSENIRWLYVGNTQLFFFILPWGTVVSEQLAEKPENTGEVIINRSTLVPSENKTMLHEL